MPWRRLVITVLIIAPILALLAYGFTRDAHYIISPLLAKPAAPFTVTLFDGRKSLWQICAARRCSQFLGLLVYAVP